MEEVVIDLTVRSEEAVAATDAETAALKRLERQAGDTQMASHKASTQSQKDLDDEARKYKTATDIVAKHKKTIEDLAKAEENRLKSNVRAQGINPATGKRGFISDAEQAKNVAAEQRKITQAMQNELRARTGYTVGELNKQTSARNKAISDQLRAERGLSSALQQEDRKRTSAHASEAARRAAAETKYAKSAAWDAAKEEDKALGSRTTRWQKFFNDIDRLGGGGGSRGGGHSFFSGGGGDGPVRRSQFSKNRFIDFGGRGAQPRTIGIGSLVGLGAAAIGPVGAAAGGLLGAVPGAAAGIGATIAAFKSSGLGAVAADAAKIKTIQDQIATGVTKEAKGRAQIAAIMKGMTPEQQKALTLWNAFHKITTDIGNKVSDQLLPAFGNLGKALTTNAPAITNSIVTAGKAWAGLINQMSSFTSSGAGKVMFSGTLGAGNTFIGGLTKNLGNLGETFLSIGNASQKFMRQMSAMSLGVTSGLAQWSASNKGQAQLKEFFAVAAQEIPRVLGLFKDLGKVLFTVFAAALPYANQFIDAVRNALQGLDKFLSSARGQQDMKSFFTTLKSAIQGVVDGIRYMWPAFSQGFNLIKGALNLLSSMFGDKLGASFTIAGSYFAAKLVKPVMSGIGDMTGALLKMALKNPWVDAIAGTALFIVWLHSLQTNFERLKGKAQDTASAISNVFKAINDKGSNTKDIGVLTMQRGLQRDSIFSQKQRISNTKTALADATPGTAKYATLTNQLKQQNYQLGLLQKNYRDTGSSIDDLKAKNAADVAKISADTKKAASDASKAWKDSMDATQKFTGKTPRSGGGATFTAPNMSAASASFQKVFRDIGFGADQASARARLVILKIAGIVEATHKVPSQKAISIIIHDAASKTLAQVNLAIRNIHDKTFKIIANTADALTPMNEIAKAHIGDKHFNIIGKIIAPSTNPFQGRSPVLSTPAGGGIIPGVGGHDTVPAMLRPGEVVLNRAQQYDFGGPDVFRNYFGSKQPGQHFAGGGIVYDGPKGAEVKSIYNPKTGVSTPAAATATPSHPTPAATTDAEPGWASVVNLLRNQAPAINTWTKKLAGDNMAYLFMRDHMLSGDYNERSDLNTEYDKIAGDKSKSATGKRKVLNLKLDRIRVQIDKDTKIKRRYAEAMVSDRAHLKVAKKVFSHIPGYDAFQGQVNNYEAAQTAIEVQAAGLHALVPGSDPNSPTGITYLTRAWQGLLSQYNASVTDEEGAMGNRISWLGGLVPQLNNRPKYQSIANAEITTDQQGLLSIMGKALSETLPSGVGPGAAITGAGSEVATDWAGQFYTKAFNSALATDAATAAYDLITNNGTEWAAAMEDEKGTVWNRIQDLIRVKDDPSYSQWRDDILGEITDDSSLYASLTQSIQAGFAQAQGSSGTSSGDQQHVQDVIDAANTLMSQVNVASATDRESLAVLTGFLKSQVPSFETGAAYVGRSGLAMVHQGERITTRGDAQQSAYGGPPNGTLTIDGTGSLGKLLAQHMSYEIGQDARRRAREHRR